MTPERRAATGLAPALAILALAFAVWTLFHWDAFRHTSVLGRWPLFDRHDMSVYFESSAWVEGAGTLYREVPSEYPLLVNLVFGAARAVSRLVPLAEGLDRFCWVWVVSSFALYGWVLHRLATRWPMSSLWLWLTPTALHFSLYRFDVYAVVFGLLGVEAIRADRVRLAALMFGIITALKGYPLFLLPAWAHYVYARGGAREAAIGAALWIGPFALGNLVTLGFSGVEGLMYAYRFHAMRTFNGESTYDAVTYVLGPAFRDFVASIPRLPVMLQAAGALLALAMRPRTHEQLMRAFLFATIVFVSFSVFYSPQFVLWLVPFVAEWSAPAVAWLVVATSWVTFAYFPVGYFNLERHPAFFRQMVAATTAVRTLLLAAVVAWRPGDPARPASRGGSR